jgi:hypothetical protein
MKRNLSVFHSVLTVAGCELLLILFVSVVVIIYFL